MGMNRVTEVHRKNAATVSGSSAQDGVNRCDQDECDRMNVARMKAIKMDGTRMETILGGKKTLVEAWLALAMSLLPRL